MNPGLSGFKADHNAVPQLCRSDCGSCPYYPEEISIELPPATLVEEVISGHKNEPSLILTCKIASLFQTELPGIIGLIKLIRLLLPYNLRTQLGIEPLYNEHSKDRQALLLIPFFKKINEGRNTDL